MTTIQATRISDGRIVVLKQIWTKNTPTEVKITRFFCNKRNAVDPKNHSVFVYDTLQSPIYKVVFFVMPYLMRVHDIKFATVGEVMECFRQIFEVRYSLTPRWRYDSTFHHATQGLLFIHRQNVAHW